MFHILSKDSDSCSESMNIFLNKKVESTSLPLHFFIVWNNHLIIITVLSFFSHGHLDLFRSFCLIHGKRPDSTRHRAAMMPNHIMIVPGDTSRTCRKKYGPSITPLAFRISAITPYSKVAATGANTSLLRSLSDLSMNRNVSTESNGPRK